MSVYLYGVVAAPFPAERTLPKGVGDPPGTVQLLRYRKLAAAVTEVPEAQTPGLQVRGMRRDMAAHAAVVDHLFNQTTTVPMRFGIVLPGVEAVIGELLQADYERLNTLLDNLAGCVELTLKGTYVEEAILCEIANEQPALTRQTRRSARPSRDARLDQGRQVVAAIRDKGEHDAQQLLKHLTPLARDIASEAPQSEQMFVNAALLVERAKLNRFDDAVQRFYENQEDRMRLEYIGPLPPYSFSRLQRPVT